MRMELEVSNHRNARRPTRGSSHWSQLRRTDRGTRSPAKNQIVFFGFRLGKLHPRSWVKFSCFKLWLNALNSCKSYPFLWRADCPRSWRGGHVATGRARRVGWSLEMCLETIHFFIFIFIYTFKLLNSLYIFINVFPCICMFYIYIYIYKYIYI